MFGLLSDTIRTGTPTRSTSTGCFGAPKVSSGFPDPHGLRPILITAESSAHAASQALKLAAKDLPLQCDHGLLLPSAILFQRCCSLGLRFGCQKPSSAGRLL